MQIEVITAEAMQALGAQIGALCGGGEVIELIGDIGAGKTTFTKGLACSLGIEDDVQSPTFTISRVYATESNLLLAHYDFYRLSDPGVMKIELAESVSDANTITVIEWAEVVADVLPADTLHITIRSLIDEQREVTLRAGGEHSQRILEELS